MDDVHGFGPDSQVEKFKEDLAAHIWFRDGGVHREGAEYDYLKRFRKRLNGAMTIELDWRVPKTCPRPVFLLTRKSSRLENC